MKPTIQTCSMAYREKNPKVRPPFAVTSASMHRQSLRHLLLCVAEISRLLDRIIVTCAALSALASPDLQNHEILSPYTKACTTRRSFYLLSSSRPMHAPKNYVSILLTSFDDIIKSHASPSHVSPRPHQCHIIRMTSATLQLDPWLTWKTQNRPKLCRSLTNRPNRWLWPLLTLTFAVTFDQKLKLLKGFILLNLSCRFWFWTLFFHWSSKIGQLAYSSLWFFQRHSSRHL